MPQPLAAPVSNWIQHCCEPEAVSLSQAKDCNQLPLCKLTHGIWQLTKCSCSSDVLLKQSWSISDQQLLRVDRQWLKHPMVDNWFQYSPPLVAFGVLTIYLPTQPLSSRGVLLFLFCPCSSQVWTSVYVKTQLQRKVESVLLPFSRILLQPDHNHIPLEDKRTLPLPKKPSGCYRKERASLLLFIVFLKAQTSLSLVK